MHNDLRSIAYRVIFETFGIAFGIFGCFLFLVTIPLLLLNKLFHKQDPGG